MKNLLRLFLFVSLTAAMLGGCSALEPDRRLGADPAPTLAPQTEIERPTYTVQRGTISEVVQVSGSAAPVVQADLYAPVSVPVAEIYFRRNQMVQAGDVIATLDTSDLQRSLEMEQASLVVAQDALRRAQAQAESNRRRYEIAVELVQLDLEFAQQQAGDSPTSEETYQINRLTLELELAQLDLAQFTTTVDPALENDVQELGLRISNLENQIAVAQVIAPISGRLISLNLAPGRLLTQGERIGLIADEANLEIRANLALSTAALLEIGMKATLLPTQQPGVSLEGEIIEFPTQLTPEDRLRIQITPEDGAILEIGESVVIFIPVAEQPNVLWLPTQAIREFNGRSFVVVLETLDNGETRQRRVDVTLGLEGNDQVEILTGLVENQVVVAP